MQGIDPSIANALRRIAMTEIPTVAFHKVLMYQNTSVVPDELLVHRIGQIPIKIEPASSALSTMDIINKMEYRSGEKEFAKQNLFKFELRVKCTRKKEYLHKTERQL